ncbi:MAG: glycosyltransferase family 9 protein [Rikenellaceae bacterium]
MKRRPKNIVVIRLSAMGDVVMISPIIAKILEQYPDVNITMVTSPQFVPFFQDIEGVSVFSVDLRNDYKGKRGIFRLFLDIKRLHRVDAIIDLHDVIRTKILRALFRLTMKKVYVIEKGRSDKKQLCLQKNKVFRPLRRTIDRYYDCFQKAGFIVDRIYKIKNDPKPMSTTASKLLGKKESVWLGIAQFAQHKGKVYPINLMEQVIEKLSTHNNLKIMLFGGGKEERFITENLAEKYPQCVSIIGKLSLREELALISNLDCMVSMDSSSAHMAGINGVKVITIWGATHPYAGFLTYGQNEEDVISVNLECRPCSVFGNKPCYKESYECMYSISPAMVIEKIENVLSL